MGKDIHAKSFDEGTQIKLHILREYLKAWIPVFVEDKKSNWKKAFIYDFFSGPGKDKDGKEGSPLIIFRELTSYCEKIRNKSMCFEVLFNDEQVKKIKELENNVQCARDQICDIECLRNCVCGFEVRNMDFVDLFYGIYPYMLQNAKLPHFLFLDQNGIRFITEEVFKKITALKKSDFIFFISSSHFKRFAKSDDFQRYLRLNDESFVDTNLYHCHRVIYEYYKSLLPDNKEYYLAPFSIKKGSSIHGLIFGSNHTLGVEKFLKICQ